MSSRYWIQQHVPADGSWVDCVGFDEPMKPEAERVLKQMRGGVSRYQSEFRLVERTDKVLDVRDEPDEPEVDEDRLGFGLEPAEDPLVVCMRCGIAVRKEGGHNCGSCGRNV